MTLSAMKYRLQRWLRRRFSPPRYYVATYGDMGLEIEFHRDPEAYDAAVEAAEEQHRMDYIDTFEHGDID